MKNKNLEKLADAYTLQKIVGAAGYTHADKEVNNKNQTVMNSKFKMKNQFTKNNVTTTPVRKRKKAYKNMEKFWDNNIALIKDHLPFPPRRGLVWDNVKHRWTRPEMAGKTVTEVSGKKRIRGTGTGTHQRAVQSKRGLRRGEAALRFREAGVKRRKLAGTRIKTEPIGRKKR
tara:strand:+ start:457 stop:975 length:519 start_codon:yes stop_codon:yes gene_type:complete